MVSNSFNLKLIEKWNERWNNFICIYIKSFEDISKNSFFHNHLSLYYINFIINVFFSKFELNETEIIKYPSQNCTCYNFSEYWKYNFRLKKIRKVNNAVEEKLSFVWESSETTNRYHSDHYSRHHRLAVRALQS